MYYNVAIRDLENNRWSDDLYVIPGETGVAGQIKYWRHSRALDPQELAEFNAWLIKEGLEASNAVSPQHYQFPGGVQVSQISGHLTSFGGQALQYIARSTRLDGQNKGDAIEDLRKAIKFAEMEIERLESNA